MNYDWDFSVLLHADTLKILLSGFWLSVVLTVTSLVLGTPLGIGIGALASLGTKPGQLFDEAARSSRSSGRVNSRLLDMVRWGTLAYIDIIRAIPLLLLILVSYYGMPVLAKSGLVSNLLEIFGRKTPLEITAFQSCVIALSINLSAFLADLFRGAVAGVPRGSVMAGRSLGMSSWLALRRIVFPEVFRDILPGLTLLYITIFKMSTLCSVVAVYEVLHSADAITQRTYKPLEAYVAVCILFVAVIVPLSAFARRLETTNLFRRRSA